MNSKRQFSLRYLLLEMLWIGMALGLSRFIVAFDTADSLAPFAEFALGSAAFTCWGAVAGGPLGRMKLGALGGFGLFVVLTVFGICYVVCCSSY